MQSKSYQVRNKLSLKNEDIREHLVGLRWKCFFGVVPFYWGKREFNSKSDIEQFLHSTSPKWALLPRSMQTPARFRRMVCKWNRCLGFEWTLEDDFLITSRAWCVIWNREGSAAARLFLSLGLILGPGPFFRRLLIFSVFAWAFSRCVTFHLNELREKWTYHSLIGGIHNKKHRRLELVSYLLHVLWLIVFICCWRRLLGMNWE